MGIETLKELEEARARVGRLKDYLVTAPLPKDDWERICRRGTEAIIFNLEEDIEEFEYHIRLKQEKLPLTVNS
jgi:hypothetical protein